MEEWRDIPGYEGVYKISSFGSIVHIRKHCTKKIGGTPTRGYLRVVLYKNGIRKRFAIHILVLTTFKGPRPAGLYGLHDNDIRTDNRVENLKWGTQSENVKDHYRNKPKVAAARKASVIRAYESSELRLRLSVSQKLRRATEAARRI